MNAKTWFYSQSFNGGTRETVSSKSDPYPEREWCPICGWRKGGKDSWNGNECKCGHSVNPNPATEAQN